MLEQFANSATQGFSINNLGILVALVALETVLSADNAVALAALVQNLQSPQHQRQALNWGLALAFLLRITLLLAATWVIQFWQFELAGALYLLWLVSKYFWERWRDRNQLEDDLNSHQPSLFWQVIPLIALTDMAFSLDSVTAAVALSSQTWLVITGCTIGVLALRFLAGLFVKWLEKFTYLQDAAYLTVLAVGLRLLCKAVLPDWMPPEWVVLILITALFTWGFSQKNSPQNLLD